MQSRHQSMVAGILPFFAVACAAGSNDSTLPKLMSECLAHHSPVYKKIDGYRWSVTSPPEYALLF